MSTLGEFSDDVYEDGQQNKDDAKLLVKFEYKAVKNEPRSIEAGVLQCDQIEYITIMIPGQRDTLVTEVTEQYKQRFASRYKRWKDQIAEPESGTPLSEVTWITASQLAEFNSVNVKTLEQLAALPDAIAQKFMGNMEIRARAQRMIERAKEAAPGLHLNAELSKRDEQIADMQRTIAELMSRMPAAELSPAGQATKAKLVPATAVKA